MSFTIMHRDGGMEDGDLSRIAALVAELDEPRDDEHPDVAISDDATGWSLSAFQTGLVVWENLEEEDRPPRHLATVPRAETDRLMRLVATGELEQIEQLPWQPGYRTER